MLGRNSMLAWSRVRITFCIVVLLIYPDASDTVKVFDRLQSFLNLKTPLPPLLHQPILNASDNNGMQLKRVHGEQLDEGHKIQHDDSGTAHEMARTGDYSMQDVQSVSRSSDDDEEREEEHQTSITKRRKRPKRRCSVCLGTGHTKRKCTVRSRSRSISSDVTLCKQREETYNETACRSSISFACTSTICVGHVKRLSRGAQKHNNCEGYAVMLCASCQKRKMSSAPTFCMCKH
jgi:hypothetical protein